MKLYLLILLLIPPFCGLCQLPSGVHDARVLVNSSFDWNNNIESLNDSTKVQLVNQILKGKNNYCEDNIPISNFHVLDIDKDGDQDIIFDGKACPGFESGQVDIYLNSKGSFIEVLGVSGTTLDFDLKNMELVIHQYPCCADRLNYIKYYSIIDNESISFRLNSKELFTGRGNEMGNHILPKTINENQKNILIQDTTILRWSPNLTDKDVLHTCSNGSTNIIASYPPNSEGHILSESADGTWLFVKMKNNISVKHSCINKRVKNKVKNFPYYTYGWIQKDKTTYNNG